MNPHNILIVLVNGIGDTVMSIPALRAIRHKFKNARISMLCQSWGPELLGHTKLIDRFYEVKVPWTLAADRSIKSLLQLIKTVWNLRKQDFDLAIHFRGDTRSVLLMYLCSVPSRISYGEFKNIGLGKYLLTSTVPIEYRGSHIMDWSRGVARYLGCEDEYLNDISLPISDGQLSYAEEVLRNSGITPGSDIIAAIHPGHRTEVRGWKIERWQQVAEYVRKQFGAKLLVLGSAVDKEVLGQIARFDSNNIIPATEPLEYLPAFIKLCKLIVCLDSAASHIAAAVKTPSVVLFGPNEPSISGPRGSMARIVIKENFDCRPCLQRKCRYPREQGNGIGACMEAISVSDVIAAINETMLVPVADYSGAKSAAIDCCT